MAEVSRAESADGESSRDAIIARQVAEIERLRKALEQEQIARELKEALGLVATAGVIGSPITHSQLLDLIVEAAMLVVSARAGSLFVIDEDAQELVFAVAIGEKADEVKELRVPLGHGIAGLVAVTGQPMAVADARQDPRHATQIAQRVGYVPDSVLAVPLFYGEQVVGVLELLDKQGAPSFGPRDIEILGLFANLGAVALEQSRAHWNVLALLTELLQAGKLAKEERHAAAQRARAFSSSLQVGADYQRALELARLVRGVVQLGEDELTLCGSILRGFADYAQTRSKRFSELGLSR